MEPRIDYPKVAPGAVTALLELGKYVRQSSLDKKLLDLVHLRASQMNGCAWCLDMHSKDLRAAGETEQRLYCLSAWRETPFFTQQERAALAWTEAVTDLHDGHVPDSVYEEARRHFSEKELVDLTTAIVVINGWNRMNVSFRTVPGTYQPATRRSGASG